MQRKRQLLPGGRKGEGREPGAEAGRSIKPLKNNNIIVRPELARSLLTLLLQAHPKGRPVVSVTSDVTASASYQSAPPKPALPDASQLSSDFASLVDNTRSPDSSNLLPSASESPPPRRSASDNAAPSRSQSSNNSPTSSASQNQPSQANNAPASNDNQANSPPTASANNDGSAPTQGSSSSSQTDSKAGKAQSSDKSSTGSSGSSTDASASTAPVDATLTPPSPVAVPITVSNALTNSPQSSGSSGAPLAIAAAAIATATSTSSAVTTAAAPTATAASPAPKTGDGAATSKTQAQATTAATAIAPQLDSTAPTTVVAQATVTGTPTTTGNANTTGSKAGAAAQGKSAATAPTGTTATTDTSGTANPAAINGTPQPGVDGKPASPNLASDAVKPDANGTVNTPAAAATTHDHSAAAGNAPAPTASADVNAQVFAVPQQLSNATAVGATDKLTVTQATGGAVPLSGLAVEIAASAQSGKTRFEVRLDPADLGRIDVRIDVDRNGQVTSHLTVDKPETLSMLQQDAPQLQQALSDAGLKTGSGGLQFSLRDQSQSGQNNQNQSGAQPQRLVISEEDSVPATVAGRSYGRMLGASGGVDISV